MTVTFTKLFSSITESTVWCEDNETRIVWITMLAMANKNGFVFGSVPGLANRARVPVESARAALAKFMQPDPDSRTKDFEGRRIEEVDGGWRLLNYEKHRAIRDEEERREYMKNLMRQKRAAATSVSNVSHGQPPLAQAEAEAESRKQRKSKAFTPPTLEEVISYCTNHPKVDAVKFWNHYEANGWKVGRNPMRKWQSAIVTWERQEHTNGSARESAAEARRRKNAEVFAQFRDEGTGNNG